MKNKEKELAIILRKDGWSIIRIASYLEVSKSTVSLWVRNVKLKKEQIDVLMYSKEKNRRLGTAANSKKNEIKRLGYQQEGKIAALKEEKDHLIGCMLYWAEGTKNRNTLCFSNSDASMLLLFKRFLDQYFPNREYTLTINCYLNNGLSKLEIEEYWLKLLRLPKTALRKGTFKTEDKLWRKNRHKYGVCSLFMKRSTDAVQHIYGAIKQYASIVDERLWLF